MYNDYRSPRREQWPHPYTGKELVDFAWKKYLHWRALEATKRKQLAALCADRTVPGSSDQFNKLQAAIDDAAREGELCKIWWHEFKRRPEAEFLLNPSDIAYFEIVPDPEIPEHVRQGHIPLEDTPVDAINDPATQPGPFRRPGSPLTGTSGDEAAPREDQ